MYLQITYEPLPKFITTDGGFISPVDLRPGFPNHTIVGQRYTA